MMQGHAQLHMNPGIHSHAAESRRGARFGTIGKGQSPCGCACNVACVQARFWGYPSLPTRPQLERQFIRDGRVHRGRERAPLCRPLNIPQTKIRCFAYTMLRHFWDIDMVLAHWALAPPRGIRRRPVPSGLAGTRSSHSIHQPSASCLLPGDRAPDFTLNSVLDNKEEQVKTTPDISTVLFAIS